MPEAQEEMADCNELPVAECALETAFFAGSLLGSFAEKEAGTVSVFTGFASLRGVLLSIFFGSGAWGFTTPGIGLTGPPEIGLGSPWDLSEEPFGL